MAKNDEPVTRPDRGGLPKLDKRKTIREQIKAASTADYPVADAEAEPQKYGGDLAKARDAVFGRKRSRAVAGIRTAAALDAWDATPSGGAEPYAVGGLVIQQLRPLADHDGAVIGVEVFLGGTYGPDGLPVPLPAGAEAHYRIVNPPTLVEDGAGPVELAGRRFREDPLASIAAAIGSTIPRTRKNRALR